MLSKREKMIFYGAVAFIFLAIFDRAVIGPSLVKMQDQEKEIAQKKFIIKKDLRIVMLKDSIEEESAKYKSYFSVWPDKMKSVASNHICESARKYITYSNIRGANRRR